MIPAKPLPLLETASKCLEEPFSGAAKPERIYYHLSTLIQLVTCEDYYFSRDPHRWHSKPSMGPVEGPKNGGHNFLYL